MANLQLISAKKQNKATVEWSLGTFFCRFSALNYKPFHATIVSRAQLRSKWKVPAILALCCILLMFSAKTLARNLEWSNTQTLAEAALKVNSGNAKVHLTMGNVLAQQVSDTFPQSCLVSGASCSCPLTEDLSSSACVCG